MEKHAQLFDVCIVCALYEEAEEVLYEFSARCKVSFDKAFSRTDLYEYRYTTIKNNRGEPLTVLVTWLADNGPVRTGLHLKPFLQEFRPRFAAMTGICAGYKEKDVRLGDLIVAEYAYHYEVGKDTIGKDGQKKHEIQTITYGVTPQILQYARSFQDWREPVARLKHPKVKQEKINGSESLKKRPPTCYIAPIASGMAVKEDEPFPWLREYINRKTLALEMEAATFYLTLQEVSSLGIHSLVVKGVSDYADGSKNDEYHKYAERASAIYLLYFIREYVTNTTMPRRSSPPSSIRDGPSEVWNVPYSRNPHFTGREELLDQLEQRLSPVGQEDAAFTHRAVLTQAQAIKGLGGIGKTQIAVEYAYRSRDIGRYMHTLWINAATKETIITSFRKIAELLPSFSAKDETDQQKLTEAIKSWLERCEQSWLLIFDNAFENDDDPSMIEPYMPCSRNGSILLTTREHALGSLASSIEVDTMGWLEGTQLLLRRAQRFDQASDEVINQAGDIVVALDHFPLALDQAGAYLEETGCSFADYLDLYQTHRQKMLARRGSQGTKYPNSVATTWSLSFQKVQKANPGAAELLHLCSFLAPDHIPEELLRDGAPYWPPLLQKAVADSFAFQQ